MLLADKLSHGSCLSLLSCLMSHDLGERNIFYVTTLIIPKQESAANSVGILEK